MTATADLPRPRSAIREAQPHMQDVIVHTEP
jgi:hypothetical protein